MRELTKEEWDELNKLREPTLEQLEFFAKLCNYNDIVIHDDYVTVFDGGICKYDPVVYDQQSHKLLEAVIKGKDCRLFHDDGVDEYFIYSGYAEHNPPVAHNQSLNKTIFQAAMELYFPEDE